MIYNGLNTFSHVFPISYLVYSELSMQIRVYDNKWRVMFLKKKLERRQTFSLFILQCRFKQGLRQLVYGTTPLIELLKMYCCFKNV